MENTRLLDKQEFAYSWVSHVCTVCKYVCITESSKKSSKTILQNYKKYFLNLIYKIYLYLLEPSYIIFFNVWQVTIPCVLFNILNVRCNVLIIYYSIYF